MSNPYIVAIGASAGGLDTVQSFMKTVEPDENICYIIIQHALRSHKSLLPQILKKYTGLPILAIKENMEISGNKVFVCPPSHYAELSDGHFKLVERKDDEKINHTIDATFSALAQEAGDRTVGIILSGTGDDGSKGCKDIEEYNGVVIVQDPATAHYEDMPMTTIKRDHPDFVMRVDEMFSLIKYLVENAQNRDLRTTAQSDFPK
ncbi:chemotaxis protein CheB [Fulvivirga ligni]|uniref:chemotaxis protein CheB n=1 Tax=Fulvivirga ligni TaxID=2904246 RepID=UPI001F318930|nr:chemotaxis protein CheB [Fulvivirga ligni]UII23368.1 chemotaxis protein CheB [Fulvivirga ligni]